MTTARPSTDKRSKLTDISAVSFDFSYKGWSGFTFSSAAGGGPALLRIETASTVPEPQIHALMLASLAAIGSIILRRSPARCRL